MMMLRELKAGVIFLTVLGVNFLVNSEAISGRKMMIARERNKPNISTLSS